MHYFELGILVVTMRPILQMGWLRYVGALANQASHPCSSLCFGVSLTKRSRQATMQSQCCVPLYQSPHHQLLHLGVHFKSTFHSNFGKPRRSSKKLIIPIHSGNNRPKRKNATKRLKGNKENVWSIDNELQKKTDTHRTTTRRVVKRTTNKTAPKVLVSGAMLMDLETVLQTEEPVVKPMWNTFISSLSGIWKGVGAVFSPITAQMEPIDIGNNHENLYDCYTISCVKEDQDQDPDRYLSGAHTNQIKRTVNWVTFNPYGERPLLNQGVVSETMVAGSLKHYCLPKFESFNFGQSDLLEQDVMGNEPGLFYFVDGSYSRGPVTIPVGEVDDTNYYINPTFKFEQCLVKCCHQRLRIVHTIEFSGGGSDIQILRVAVYEEKWVSPANISDISDVEFDILPFSQRKRTKPQDLTGSWKVFEVSGSPIFGEETVESSGTPYAYLCTESITKRSLPGGRVGYFGEEEDVTMLWLPGGVTGYVDVKKDGILCIGVGWYSDEGINLVMERDYGLDGNLKEVTWKSEVKRRCKSDPSSPI